jgi:sterol desaturase/sphingolipid hydroxylase (fatty acid hydroxylase superfamily)
MFSILKFSAIDPSWLEFTFSDVYVFGVLAVFTLLWRAEVRHAGNRRPTKTLRQSYCANLGTLVLNDTLMSLLSVSSLLVVAESYSHFGLLSGISNPLLKGLLAFVLLDLVLYLWHRANHAFDWLWMFHKVHHSDPCMNVSTAFRLHFVEVFLTTVVKAVLIVAAGVDTTITLVNEAIVTLFVMFHHANLSFRGQSKLGRVITVPYLHRVHHSARRDEHDHNYGAVFSIWDRAFGTLAELKPARIGLKDVGGLGIWELVKFGLTYQTEAPNPETLRAMIAEAAYYKAERRGFKPGWELADWVEAEREIRGSI